MPIFFLWADLPEMPDRPRKIRQEMPTDYRWTDLSDENEIDRVCHPRIIHTNGSLIILGNSSVKIGRTSFTDFVFPLDFDATYTIGSNTSRDFFLPTKNDDTIKVYVENYEVLISESYLIPIVSPRLPEIVIPGGLIELKESMKIQFGSFALMYITENTSSLSFKKQLTYGVVCQSCCMIQRGLYVLECGHLICSACVDSSFISQIDTFNSRGTIAVLFDYFRCRLCRALNRFTDIRLDDLIHPSLVNLLKSMNDVSKHEIMCSSCRNTRVFINPEEFYECQTCLLTLCSLCSLSNFHRTHDIVSLTVRGTARLCKMFKTIYASEREIEALLSRKKEFYKNHLTTKRGTLRNYHLKLKSSSVDLRWKILPFGDNILRLESNLVKCAHIYNDEMEKRCDELIEKSSKQLYEDSKIYVHIFNKLDGNLDAVVELLDVRLPVLLAEKEVDLKY